MVEFGDPAQDVSNATLVFLIDGKLVALQPTSNKEGELKYQMRVIAQNVEFFAITTTDRPSDASDAAPQVELAADNTPLCTTASAPRHEPLWYFDGQAAHMWTDHRQMATNSRLESSKDWPQPLKVALDFYPLSLAVDSGVLIGIESELVQRRDVDFSLYRTAIRVCLLPSRRPSEQAQC